MSTRRDFIRVGVGAGAALAFSGGCLSLGAGCRDANSVVPPYEDMIRDRLWMWGHGGVAFDRPRHTFGIPEASPIEMNDACKFMGIPNVCVCRYQGLPDDDECAAYLKTFKDIKRIAFSIVDGAGGNWREKYELAKRLRTDNPNLGTVWLDDYFTPQTLSRPEGGRGSGTPSKTRLN